jgi:hypothetical protein
MIMEVVCSKVYAVMNAASSPYSVLIVILLISNIFTDVRFEALCMAILFVRSISLPVGIYGWPIIKSSIVLY